MPHTKSNADHLRELINSDSYSKDEALEFITAIEEEIKYAGYDLKQAEQERDLIQQELDDQPELTEVFLGLDTLHYSLENGNLKISQQMENFINGVKNQNGAGVLINHG